jgi:hypothetical protein
LQRRFFEIPKRSEGSLSNTILSSSTRHPPPARLVWHSSFHASRLAFMCEAPATWLCAECLSLSAGNLGSYQGPGFSRAVKMLKRPPALAAGLFLFPEIRGAIRILFRALRQARFHRVLINILLMRQETLSVQYPDFGKSWRPDLSRQP